MSGVIEPGIRPNLRVGGRVFTDLKNLITLVGYTNGPTNVRSTFRRTSGTAGYAPAVGKKFVCAAVEVHVNSAAIVPFTVAYSDNDVGIRVSTAFTNPVYVAGNAAAHFNSQNIGGSVDQPFQSNCVNGFEIPAGKYPGLLTAGSLDVAVTLYGYEVDA